MLMTLSADDPEAQARIAAFLQGLQQTGWTVGRNMRIEYRWGAAMRRTRKYAAELVALAPEVILAGGTLGAVAAGDPYRADRIRAGPDPVGAGLVG